MKYPAKPPKTPRPDVAPVPQHDAGYRKTAAGIWVPVEAKTPDVEQADFKVKVRGFSLGPKL